MSLSYGLKQAAGFSKIQNKWRFWNSTQIFRGLSAIANRSQHNTTGKCKKDTSNSFDKKRKAKGERRSSMKSIQDLSRLHPRGSYIISGTILSPFPFSLFPFAPLPTPSKMLKPSLQRQNFGGEVALAVDEGDGAIACNFSDHDDVMGHGFMQG